METVPGHHALAAPPREAVVAIGNFDGVHVGHQHIFRLVAAQARARRGTACVLTFEPHPARVLAPELAPPLIVPLSRKLELIAACGIDLCVVEPFDLAFAARPPDAFVDEILARALSAREVVVGQDFTYGRGRAGTVETLRAAGPTHGFALTAVDKVTVGGLVASSSKVRELVLEGKVDGAARLLGRPFELCGPAIRGAGRGRTIGVPTANLQTEYELLPRQGVYAGWVRLPDARGRHGAAINIGFNPTFSQNDALSVEAHILDWNGDLYGQRITIEFAARLRGEERFPNAQALVAQIERDIEKTRVILARQGGDHGAG
ncbi:MAG TPA: bifunctional riboflavin kinase/FAD synthetase [Polyangia bacterium]|nr:bifunctional riboflavin kinase/FAD synthetase [Polyangia bacterium]